MTEKHKFEAKFTPSEENAFHPDEFATFDYHTRMEIMIVEANKKLDHLMKILEGPRANEITELMLSALNWWDEVKDMDQMVGDGDWDNVFDETPGWVVKAKGFIEGNKKKEECLDFAYLPKCMKLKLIGDKGPEFIKALTDFSNIPYSDDELELEAVFREKFPNGLT